MSERADPLYRGPLLEHARRPRNAALPTGAHGQGRGDNPLCGDRLDVAVRLAGDTVEEAGFTGLACAVTRASASLMTEAVRGRTIADGHALAQRVQRLLDDPQAPPDASLGELCTLADVAAYPSRHQCALLPWSALRAALSDAAVRRPGIPPHSSSSSV